MKIRYGLLTLGLVVGSVLTGCSNRESGEFREYISDSSQTKALLKPSDDPANPASRRQVDSPNIPTSNGTAKKTAAPSAGFSDVLPAAIGPGSWVILGENFRVRSEQWLNPVVGPAATIALLAKVEADTRPTPVDVKTSINPLPLKTIKKREVKILVKERQFRSEGPDGALRVSYDDLDLLKVLNMDPVTPDAPKHMPQWLKDLDGKRIRIRGFMSPAFKQTGLEGFLMGRDNKACCFPGRAKIYDLFPVRLKQGVTTQYIQNRPFDVVGTFRIKPWIEDGEILRLYRIVDAVVVQ